MTDYRISLEWNDEDFYQDSSQGISRLPTPEVVAEKKEQAMAGAMQTIHEIGEQLVETLRKMSVQPSNAKLEFGLKLGADSGVITKGTEKAHFIVRLEWESYE